MNNIKQITNYSISNLESITKTFQKGGDAGHVVSWEYKIIPQTVLQGTVIKLGYCCKDIYKDFPIYLTINGVEKTFFIGKTGMFEYQPEEWKDANTGEEKNIKVVVTEIKVPTQVEFVLDYVYEM